MSTPIRPATGEDVNLSRVVGYPAVTGTALVGHGGVNSCGALTMRAGRPVDPGRQPEDDPMGASVVIAAHWRSAGAGDQASLGMAHANTSSNATTTPARSTARRPPPSTISPGHHPPRPRPRPIRRLLPRALRQLCRPTLSRCSSHTRRLGGSRACSGAVGQRRQGRTRVHVADGLGDTGSQGYAAPKWTRSASALRGRRTETR